MAENTSTEKLPYKIFLPGEITLTMKDVGGYEEAKLEVMDYINFLKHPETYKKVGAKMPRGMLLYGPPGTGKTLLARATAGEGNTTFITCAASSFLSDENGPGNLKKVFELATKHAPCVLYFEKIDCIGQVRSQHWSGSITPVPQLLSLTEELLVQLDGFETDRESAILVIGSTHQIESLDQALLRAGRFDRKVNMDVPNIEARMAIFKVHLKPTLTKLNKDKLIPKLALLTSNFTGAEISATCNEAAMIAARESNDHVTMEYMSIYLLCIIPKTDRLCSQCQIREVPYTNMETLLNTLALLTSGKVSELMMDDSGINTNSASYWDLEDATLIAMNIGKTTLLMKTLEHARKIYNPAPSKVVFLYGCWQDIYNNLRDSLKAQGIKIEFKQEGVITKDDLEAMAEPNGGQSMIVIDDNSIVASENKDVVDAFTNARHNNCSIVLLLHFIFGNQNLAKIRANTGYYFLLKSCESAQLVALLGIKMGLKGALVRAYEQEARKPYGYVLIDRRAPSPHTNIESDGTSSMNFWASKMKNLKIKKNPKPKLLWKNQKIHRHRKKLPAVSPC